MNARRNRLWWLSILFRWPYILGIYQFFSKVIAYRADWCNLCEKEIVAYQYQKFYVLHFFWIPLIPLGIYKTWRCSECGANPRYRTQTSRRAYIFGVVGLLLMIAVIIKSSEFMSSTRTGVLILLCILGILILLWAWRRHATQPVPALPRVKPLANHKCLLCEGVLVGAQEASCVNCGARRLLS